MRLSPEQSKQLVNTKQLYRNWQDAKVTMDSLAGNMSYTRVGDREYLYRDKTVAGKKVRKSLGVRSAENDAHLEAYRASRAAAKERMEAIREQLGRQAGYNVAVGISRVPAVVGNVLRSLSNAKVSNITTVGTNALYAYESLFGSHFNTEVLATGDVDLLVDTRRRLRLSIDHEGDIPSIVSILQKADRSFTRSSSRSYNLFNKTGFEVEFLKAVPKSVRRHSDGGFSGLGIEPVEVSEAVPLLNAPKLDEIIIDTNGYPAPIRTVDPLTFSIYKMAMSHEALREPAKKPRDRAQSLAVAELIIDNGYEGGLDLERATWLPRSMVDEAHDLLEVRGSRLQSRAIDMGF